VATDRRLLPRGHRNLLDVSLLIIIFGISCQIVIYILFCLVRQTAQEILQLLQLLQLSRVSYKLVSIAL
jgi:hypothetical protein